MLPLGFGPGRCPAAGFLQNRFAKISKRSFVFQEKVFLKNVSSSKTGLRPDLRASQRNCLFTAGPYQRVIAHRYRIQPVVSFANRRRRRRIVDNLLSRVALDDIESEGYRRAQHTVAATVSCRTLSRADDADSLFERAPVILAARIERLDMASKKRSAAADFPEYGMQIFRIGNEIVFFPSKLCSGGGVANAFLRGGPPPLA